MYTPIAKQSPFGVHQADVHVVGLVGHRRAGHQPHRRRGLVVDRRQPRAENLERDRVQCSRRVGRLTRYLARSRQLVEHVVDGRMSANSWTRTFSEAWCSWSVSEAVASLRTVMWKSIIIPSRAVDSTQMLVLVPARMIVVAPLAAQQPLQARRARDEARVAVLDHDVVAVLDVHLRVELRAVARRRTARCRGLPALGTDEVVEERPPVGAALRVVRADPDHRDVRAHGSPSAIRLMTGTIVRDCGDLDRAARRDEGVLHVDGDERRPLRDHVPVQPHVAADLDAAVP